MKPGRNDPCPCGSGKKYKHCCLAAATTESESPQELTWRRVRRAAEGFPATMTRFVEDMYGFDAVDEAWEEFTLWEDAEYDTESPHLPVFLPWFFHHWMPDPLEDTTVLDESLHNRPPTAVFLERRSARLDPLHRRFLQACLDTPLSFYELKHCDPGRGFLAHDIFTGEEHDVLERSASRFLQTGDILYGQLVAIDGVVMMEACAPCPIPPIRKIDVLELRSRLMPGENRLAREPARELLRAWDVELRELYIELAEEVLYPPPVEVHNTDGEFVVPLRVTFDIDSAQLAFESLNHLALADPEDDLLDLAERDADGVLARVQLEWKKPGNELHASWNSTILGHLEITSGQLTANVNSTERAEAFRKIVEETLGEHARYRGTELVEQVETSPAEDRAQMEEHARLAGLPEVRAALDNMLRSHYDSWVTQKLPALGDRSPLEVAQNADGREKVEALVTQIERDGYRMNPPVDGAIFRRLRERLGLAASSP